jgi:hypothetical protein
VAPRHLKRCCEFKRYLATAQIGPEILSRMNASSCLFRKTTSSQALSFDAPFGGGQTRQPTRLSCVMSACPGRSMGPCPRMGNTVQHSAVQVVLFLAPMRANGLRGSGENMGRRIGNRSSVCPLPAGPPGPELVRVAPAQGNGVEPRPRGAVVVEPLVRAFRGTTLG